MPATAKPSPSVFVFGSVNIDLVCRVAAIARPGETVLSPRYEQYFGGKGANQAVAAARASTVPVALAGAVGEDDLGRSARDQLESEAIDTSNLRTATERTGCAFITIDRNGENAITVASGANLEAMAGAIDPSCFAAGCVLVLQMEIPFEQSLLAAQRMKTAGGRVIVNLAPVPDDLRQDDLARLLAATDVLVVNESELAAAGRLSQLADSEPDAMAEALAATFPVAVIATLGADGVLVADGEKAAERLQALPVEVVDTTGAGDTFVGVFAGALAGGASKADAARRAAVAASLACRNLGAQSAMPRAEEIDAALSGR